MALIAFLKRPAAYGAVILGYIGIFITLAMGAAIIGENHSRSNDLCRVVRNVHTNAEFRARTERESLRSTRQWIYDHRYESESEQDELTRRVRESLPVVERRYTDAMKNVAATEPPASCRIERES